MNLQQLRYVFEVARSGLNVSEAAAVLHTSQPGVSKQIRLLEEELGVDVFVRQGRRLTAVTDPGREVLKIAERLLRDIDNLRSVGEEFGAEESGTLTLATTHTQARYVLPPIIGEFLKRHPNVRVNLRQGSPAEVCERVLAGTADLAIATEAIGEQDDLLMLPCYQWNRCVIARPDHPILKSKPLTLEAIAQYPIVTYDFAFTGRSQINKAFAARGLTPNVVLTAIDADIIKTYVALGLGIGIVATMAFDPKADRNLRAVDAAHLFESATTRIGVRRNAWLRGFTYGFIELFAPHLTRKMVMAALAGEAGSDPGL
ncbi:MAG: HTH-type transcriptional regulator CysB [Rhodocyclaceae bacterium]|nr:HTH-type transcriptional regulator CysB [Rhodocyclaceae bacterium]MCB1892750.1 HTH-type transcriptional regulator CysB [Rhodocyclaceae bacterium]MCO5096604.1 HTH-type transcriptional regulator CysB [Rhodocyclaceae bacterium]